MTNQPIPREYMAGYHVLSQEVLFQPTVEDPTPPKNMRGLLYMIYVGDEVTNAIKQKVREQFSDDGEPLLDKEGREWRRHPLIIERITYHSRIARVMVVWELKK